MYNTLSELPTASSARFIKSGSHKAASVQIQANFSIKDNTRNIKRSVTQDFVLTRKTSGGDYDVTALPPQEVTDIVASTVSDSGDRKAVLREITSQKKRFVEIWKGNILEASKEVTDVHESFYGDDHLASLSFSAFENAIVYTAEAKRPDASNFERFRYTPLLGEGFGEKKRPQLFIFRWGESDPSVSTVSVSISNVQSSITPKVFFGQAVFSPVTPGSLYATGYEYTSDGILLGVRYCVNRPLGIWELTLSSTGDSYEANKLTGSRVSCRSPRITPSGTMVWLSNQSGGPHGSASTLESLNITRPPSDKPRTLMEVVDEPSKQGDFPGLYAGFSLSSDPFVTLRDDAYLVVQSFWGSRQTLLLVSLSTGELKDLTPDTDNALYSYSFLSSDGRSRILCERSTPTFPHELVLGELSEDDGQVKWTIVSQPQLSESVRKSLETLRAEILPVPDRFPTESIVVHPSSTEGSKPPCVIIPHGGPHTTATTTFSATTACLALEGYTVSKPNYTGSLGFGDRYVQALLGQCGTLDVGDCIESVRHLIRQGIAEEGPGKLFLAGGSHGGYLTAHLIGQFPTMFTSAVLQNPVISAGDIANTDIPDWYYSEMGFAQDYPVSSYPETSPAPTRITTKMFDELQRVSPISYTEKVQADVLLLMGSDDRRVAPAQGLGYYHALKGVSGAEREVDLLWFEGEGHPLEGVEASRVVWECTRDWFAKKRR